MWILEAPPQSAHGRVWEEGQSSVPDPFEEGTSAKERRWGRRAESFTKVPLVCRLLQRLRSLMQPIRHGGHPFPCHSAHTVAIWLPLLLCTWVVLGEPKGWASLWLLPLFLVFLSISVRVLFQVSKPTSTWCMHKSSVLTCVTVNVNH